MKKIFKSLLISSAFCGLTLPIVSCSNNDNQNKTIEIVSDVTDLTIMENETHTSKPVIAKCYGPDKQEQQMDIKFSLQVEGNETLPNWIYLTENNEIKLTGGKEIGSYKFSVIAYNETEQIYSKPKVFMVKVISERNVLPTSIKISIEDNKYCMVGESTTLPIEIIPSREETEEKYLIKSCKFNVEVLSGLDKDLNGDSLFKFSDSNIDPDLIVSKATDESYFMQYKIRITAYIVDHPEVQTSSEITLTINNVFVYVDSDTGYTYTRTSCDSDWELTQVPSDTKSINQIATDNIQNKPVSKIGANLCANSQITQLCEIKLPENITEIGDNAFEKQHNITLVSFPKVKKIGKWAFKNCYSMEYDVSVDEPNLTIIDDGAFYKCKKFKIGTKQDLVYIGDNAFFCADLRSVTIGENCEHIGTTSFSQNPYLSYFAIYTKKPPTLIAGAFTQTYGLTTIHVPSESLEEYRNNYAWSLTNKTFEGI